METECVLNPTCSLPVSLEAEHVLQMTRKQKTGRKSFFNVAMKVVVSAILQRKGERKNLQYTVQHFDAIYEEMKASDELRLMFGECNGNLIGGGAVQSTAN